MRPALRLESSAELSDRTPVRLKLALLLAVGAATYAGWAARTLTRLDDRLTAIEGRLDRVECLLEPSTCPRAAR